MGLGFKDSGFGFEENMLSLPSPNSTSENLPSEGDVAQNRGSMGVPCYSGG